jgi:capsular polysaccharide biosynthesis protein
LALITQGLSGGLEGYTLQDIQFNGRGHTPIRSAGTSSDDRLGEMYRDDSLLPQIDPVQVVWRRLWIVLLVAVVFAGLVAGVSFYQTPMYEASIKILIGQKLSNEAPNDLGNELQGLQQITLTMVEAVNTRPVAQGVIQRLNLSTSPESFQKNLKVQQIGESQFIEVSYKATDPEKAQLIANSVGEVFTKEVSEVSPSANAITATVWEQAVVPDSPVSPNPARNALLALVLGLMLGVGLAFLLDYLDDEWRSAEEVEKISGVPTFGVIPAFKVRKNK